MGVRGLKSFIEKHDGLFITDYKLHDTHLVFDASNLISVLYTRSQKHERGDLFGGDMVQFGRYLNVFFNNLKRCCIEPILVFDGAQTHDQNKSKTAEKFRRALDRFRNVMSINKIGFGDFILPATATNVFRSVCVDLNLDIIQCMYEADAEVARIAHTLKCPVVSNDSDFFLMNLPHGLITIDLLQHEQVKRDDTSPDAPFFYIECSFFKQEHFAKYLPGLDIHNLPLLGVLAGNDFVGTHVFDQICARFPLNRILESKPGPKSFKKVTNNKQHEKILKILFYLCNKSLSETINQICNQVPRERRSRLKQLIQSNLRVYKVPDEDDFKQELKRLYWKGFVETYRKQADNNQAELSEQFELKLDQIIAWLRTAFERSVLMYRCLELANRNTVFIIGHMDDPTLGSAHKCQIRPMRVMMALLRSTYNEMNSCLIYDRVENRYTKQVVKPLKHLENFGTLNYTFFDVPEISPTMRRSILLATFYSCPLMFDENIVDYYGWFEGNHANAFLTTKILMDYVDLESADAKLWKHFRQATLLCMMYYFYKDNTDKLFVEALRNSEADISSEFMDDLISLIKARKYDRMPVLQKKRKYNCRLMHQITQLHISIVSFNTLNAFLGDVMSRIRSEDWLNSCLIYNMAEALHTRSLRLPQMPTLIKSVERS